MAKIVEKLSDVKIRSLKKRGYYGDGKGLYLQVSPSGSKSWVFRYRRRGVGPDAPLREMGLGPYGERDTTLAKARDDAGAARALLRAGIDPIDDRKAKRLELSAQASKVMAFKEASQEYIKAHKAGWKNPKHVQQWENTLATYAYPTLGHLGVADIDAALVSKVLEPIWTAKTETAARLRGRIEAILDWAKAKGLRDGENPAALKGNLDHLLAPRKKVQKRGHHPALPYMEIGEFMTKLRASTHRSARGLELLILTAARTNEVIEAVWSEFDMEEKTWTIPAERMKANKEHRIPLSEAAVVVLEDLRRSTRSKYVMPGRDPKKPASNMIFLKLLERMGKSNITAHGFRSSFQDWGIDVAKTDQILIDMALAHTIPDKTRKAYLRTDVFERRRDLMADWASYCATVQRKGVKVVSIHPEVAA